MDFEFDTNKSQSNKAKHGIDFNEAQKLWQDPERIELDAKSGHEQRMMVIGKIVEKFWSAVTTQRDEKTRIISVRRARKEEIKLYED